MTIFYLVFVLVFFMGRRYETREIAGRNHNYLLVLASRPEEIFNEKDVSRVERILRLLEFRVSPGRDLVAEMCNRGNVEIYPREGEIKDAIYSGQSLCFEKWDKERGLRATFNYDPDKGCVTRSGGIDGVYFEIFQKATPLG